MLNREIGTLNRVCTGSAPVGHNSRAGIVLIEVGMNRHVQGNMIIAPKRIVCLSAEAADWLWRIGAWDRVVGTTAFQNSSERCAKAAHQRF